MRPHSLGHLGGDPCRNSSPRYRRFRTYDGATREVSVIRVDVRGDRIIHEATEAGPGFLDTSIGRRTIGVFLQIRALSLTLRRARGPEHDQCSNKSYGWRMTDRFHLRTIAKRNYENFSLCRKKRFVTDPIRRRYCNHDQGESVEGRSGKATSRRLVRIVRLSIPLSLIRDFR